MAYASESTDAGRPDPSASDAIKPNGHAAPNGTPSEHSTPLPRKLAHLHEDSTPTPSRTASPRRSNSALGTRPHDGQVRVGRAPTSRARSRDSPPSRGSSPAASSGFYDDSLSPSNRAPSPDFRSQPIDSTSTDDDDEVDKAHMPSSSGGSGAPRSHDDGRSGAGSSSNTARAHATPRTSSAQPGGPAAAARRQQPGRQIYATPPGQYYASPPSEGYRNSPPGSAPHPPAISPTYPAAVPPATYPARTGYMGQYTMSPQPGPPPSIPYSQPQYQYPAPPHHPGLISTDSGIPAPQYPSIGYSSAPPLAHGLQPAAQSHAPSIYQFPRYSPEGASSTGAPIYHPVHTSTPTEHSPYDPMPTSGSPHPHSPSPFSPQHASPSFSGYNYPALSPTPQFPNYTRESFPTHAAPFQPQYPHSYTYVGHPSSEEAVHQQGGTWWYIPQGVSASGPPPTSGPYDQAQRSFQGMYTVGGYAQRPDLDAYGNPTSQIMGGSDNGQFPSSPHAVRSVSTLSGPSSGTPQAPGTAPSYASSVRAEGVSGPTSSQSPGSGGQGGRVRAGGQGGLVEHSGESGSEKGPVRRSYHPNPPSHRSDWVMWVGNVPNDATHDELWRFFKQPLQGRSPQLSPSVSQSSLASQPTLLPAGLLSPDGSDTYGESSALSNDGVVSIFLISRSNCAFVNYISEAHLLEAVKRFNGISLRPNDPRCPKLVCRVRGKDDDLRAGVGGQRGQGIHLRWIREQKEKERVRRGGLSGKGKGKEKSGEGQESTEEERSSEPPATPSDLGDPSSSPIAHSFSSGGEDSYRNPASSTSSGSAPKHSGSSGSYASTNSSILQQHFPKRYFILKSLTQYDLNISKEKGIWATQPHNEEVLNQAFRTSKDVYLIFSVNKSGEFFGYARMAGPIGNQGERISWASRTSSSHSHSPSASLSSVGKASRITESIPEEKEGQTPSAERSSARTLFSPDEQRLVEGSPQPITPSEQQRIDAVIEGNPSTAPAGKNPASTHRPATHEVASAPAVLHNKHRAITAATPMVPSETFDFNVLRRPPPPKLDPTAPQRAVRDQAARGPSITVAIEDEDHVKRKDTMMSPAEQRMHSYPLPASAHHLPPLSSEPGPSILRSRDENLEEEAGWGTPFKVQWIKTTPLPFHRTRHLRNPWNHDREVKVSRDGTELEPGVGEALIQEWDVPEPAPASPATSPTVSRKQRTPFRGGAQAETSTLGTPGPASGTQRQYPRAHGGDR